MKPLRSIWPLNKDVNQRVFSSAAKALGGRVSFGTGTSNMEADRNMDTWDAIGGTPGTANTEFQVPHFLTRIPKTFFGHTNNGGVLYAGYAGMTPWTAATSNTLGSIYLKCTTASANFTIIIV